MTRDEFIGFITRELFIIRMARPKLDPRGPWSDAARTAAARQLTEAEERLDQATLSYAVELAAARGDATRPADGARRHPTDAEAMRGRGFDVDGGRWDEPDEVTVVMDDARTG